MDGVIEDLSGDTDSSVTLNLFVGLIQTTTYDLSTK